MINRSKQYSKTVTLPRLAEDRFREGRELSLDTVDQQVSEEIRLMFHQLCAHQIELELQNETLRQTQGELESARARYFDLYDQAPVGYLTLSATGLIVEANLTAANLLDAARDALIGQPLTSFVHADDQDRFYLYRKQNLDACEGPNGCELRMAKQDGTLFWAHLAATTVQQAGGPAECRVVINDISNLKRTEKAMMHNQQNATEAKNLLKLVLDTIPVRLFWKDLNSVYLGCNVLFAQDAGYQVPEELIGLDDYDMVWKEQAEMYRRDDLEVMNSGKPKWRYGETQTTPAGKQIWLATSKVPLRDADDTIIGILGAYEDITQRKWAEEELLKAQKLESLGLLSAGIAHDFNNILMVILGNISFAKMQLSPRDKAYQRLVDAETASLKAKNLTQQFLTFSKGGAPVKNAISAAYLVRNYGHFALSGTTATCDYSLPDDLWKIAADEGQIGQVITNILINADQSMPEGGTIRVEGENVVVTEEHGLPLRQGNYLKISFKDTGNGIPEEYLGKIFDPYFTTKAAGRGLGLASAYSIMNKHEGCIVVESSADAGTTVTLYIPALTSQESPPEVEELETLVGTGKILIMDDDAMILQIVGAALEDLGYEVAVAHDGQAAVAMYADAWQTAQPFDAVITDLTVPGGMGGKEAVRQLLKIDPRAKVIVSSGYCNDPVMADYQSYGFSGMIAKPYCLTELRKQMQRVLRL